MSGSVAKERKGMRTGKDKPEQPVTIQESAGPKPQAMTDVKDTPATEWLH